MNQWNQEGKRRVGVRVKVVVKKRVIEVIKVILVINLHLQMFYFFNENFSMSGVVLFFIFYVL